MRGLCGRSFLKQQHTFGIFHHVLIPELSSSRFLFVGLIARNLKSGSIRSRCLRFVIGSIIHIDNRVSFLACLSLVHSSTVSKEYVPNVTKFILNLPFGLAGSLISMSISYLLLPASIIFLIFLNHTTTADKKIHLMQLLQRLRLHKLELL